MVVERVGVVGLSPETLAIGMRAYAKHVCKTRLSRGRGVGFGAIGRYARLARLVQPCIGTSTISYDCRLICDKVCLCVCFGEGDVLQGVQKRELIMCGAWEL